MYIRDMVCREIQTVSERGFRAWFFGFCRMWRDW